MSENGYDPEREQCPKCSQWGFQLDYHGVGVIGALGTCNTPLFCSPPNKANVTEEHMLMTCYACGYRMRKQIEYFNNGR